MPLRPRGRLAGRRGATTVLVATLGSMLMAGLGSVAELSLVSATDARAQTLADAAAHAAAGALAATPDRDAAVLAARAATCVWAEDRPEMDPACGPALEAARAVLARVPAARLLHLAVIVDPRSVAVIATGGGKVALQAEATVAVDRRLPLLGRMCMDGPGRTSGLCFAIAAAGAQEVSP